MPVETSAPPPPMADAVPALMFILRSRRAHVGIIGIMGYVGLPTVLGAAEAEINTHMPHHVVACLAEAMDRALGRGLSRSHVLLLGAAYKKNLDDTRESPALKLIELIEARGATVEYHDPHVPVLLPAERHDMSAMQSVPLDPERISGYDAVLIVTDHDAVDYAALVRHAKLVVDTRYACHKRGLVGDSIVKA